MLLYKKIYCLAFTGVLLVMLSGCGEGIVVTEPEREVSDTQRKLLRTKQQAGERESVFGDGGFFGLGDSNGQSGGSGGIGVNTYLWRATLDTINFMPVTSADAFGGVIITDWRASQDSPDERFKMNIYILGRELRADGVRVSVFRQVLQNNLWRDAEVPSRTTRQIEDAILTRARQLRHEVLASQ